MSNEIIRGINIVSSGRFDEMTGVTNWLNLRAFTAYEDAVAWVESEKRRDKSFNEDKDFYEIESLSLYEYQGSI